MSSHHRFPAFLQLLHPRADQLSFNDDACDRHLIVDVNSQHSLVSLAVTARDASSENESSTAIGRRRRTTFAQGLCRANEPWRCANFLAIAGDCVSDAWSAQCRTSKVSTSHSTE